jgi:tripartite-type tricarboxylate transporter receptor subunit TctC
VTYQWNWLRSLFAAALVFAACPSTPVQAQSALGQEVRFLCGYPAGSGADAIVRFFADRMRAHFDRPAIVENKPGALSNIATEYAARAKPDGRTIFINGGTALAANMHLFRNTVDAGKAFQVVATFNRQMTMIAVGVDRPWKTLAELTEAMKAKGSKATYGTSNSSARAMGALYKNAAGLEQAVEVLYKTSNDMLSDLATGSLDFTPTDPVFAIREESAGRVRVLAVSSAERLQSRPDLPTMTELGIPMDLVAWWGAMVPTETPRPLVMQLNKWFNEIVVTEEAKKFFNNFGSDPWASTPDEGQAVLLKDIKEWADLVRIANIEKQG